ncbi:MULTISPECIES: polysaccharide pyruvyl transferase family protein [unclassified Haloferax]|uniref:polysaccharide pyruvyl transferase family protein n=1 Tax=unclassified Haloferax TaxID=2625095 RepID=UPI0028742241|nr:MULTISPECIES: polysaccharide pyruvyl transferase family protein [unclassified Haloferax]MDS0239881.1 polysaccharide pyruvyl transferase family protein [Haloferax sp. S2CR25]MDS0443002.1 polysaccharide pyruvyl transferase family protein [Haloferax sp. S2CR25-2]
MDVLFVSDTSREENWGSQATTAALRSVLKTSNHSITDTIFLDEISNSCPRIRVPNLETVLRSVYRLGIFGINRGFGTSYNRGRVILPQEWFDDIPTAASELDSMVKKAISGKRHKELVDRITAVDHVVINGEGSIHGCQRQARFLLYIGYLSSALGNPTHLVNHSVELDDPVIEKIAKKVYPNFDTVTFREPVSLRHFPDDVEVSSVLSADAAFLFEPTRNRRDVINAISSGAIPTLSNREVDLDPSDPYVAVGGSSAFNLKPSFDPSEDIGDIVEQLDRATQVILTSSARADEQFLQQISETHDVPLVPVDASYKDAIDLIGNASAYVGGRWHPSIFAARGGATLVLFGGNTHKIQGLVEHLDLNQRVYDPFNLDSDIDKIIRRAIDGVESGKDDKVAERASKVSELVNKNVP